MRSAHWSNPTSEVTKNTTCILHGSSSLSVLCITDVLRLLIHIRISVTYSLQWMLGLAVQIGISHMEISGLDIQSQCLTPTSYQWRRQEAAVTSEMIGFPSLMLPTCTTVPAPELGLAIGTVRLVNQLSGPISLHFFLFMKVYFSSLKKININKYFQLCLSTVNLSKSYC